MSKESNFLIYCMERYRYFKGLSGADVAKNFEKYDIYGYITKYFESLHTMGDNCIVQDIDDIYQQYNWEQKERYLKTLNLPLGVRPHEDSKKRQETVGRRYCGIAGR